MRVDRKRITKLIWIILVAAALYGFYLYAEQAFFTIGWNSLFAGLIVLSSFALGYLPATYLARKFTLAEQLITAWAIGAGLLSIVVLVMGVVGWMNWFVWWAGMLVLAIVGAVTLYSRIADRGREQIVFEARRGWSLLIVVIIPFLFVAACWTTLPPGQLWPPEGADCGVLVNGLQIPKEWYQADRISYLPHNIFGNLPSGAQMFYLLAMILRRDPHAAATLCQFLHLGFVAGAVAAVWIFARRWGPLPAAFAAVAMGTSGWLLYLAPLAYTAGPMLFSATVCVGLLVRSVETSQLTWKTSILIGLLLGMTGGYSYLGLAMLGSGVFLAVLLAAGVTSRIRAVLRCPAVMLLSMAAAMSPWLIRNVCWTGNPVFPLAYAYLGGRDWDDPLAERWQGVYGPKAADETPQKMLAALYWGGFRNIIGDYVVAESYRSTGQTQRTFRLLNSLAEYNVPTFGLAMLALPWIIFFTRRQKLIDWLLLLVFAAQTCVWLFLTSQQGVLLVPWLAVLPFMVGRSAFALSCHQQIVKPIILAIILMGSAALSFWNGHDRDIRYRKDIGNTDVEYLKVVNAGPMNRVVLIGESRPFLVKGTAIYWTVFNRNEFTRLTGTAKDRRDLRDYLAEIRPDYIYVDWDEIERLKKEYGFDDPVAPMAFRYLSSAPHSLVKRIGGWGKYQKAGGPARVLHSVIYSQSEEPGRVPPWTGRSR
jgi:hypothetical protein